MFTRVLFLILELKSPSPKLSPTLTEFFLRKNIERKENVKW